MAHGAYSNSLGLHDHESRFSVRRDKAHQARPWGLFEKPGLTRPRAKILASQRWGLSGPYGPWALFEQPGCLHDHESRFPLRRDKAYQAHMAHGAHGAYSNSLGAFSRSPRDRPNESYRPAPRCPQPHGITPRPPLIPCPLLQAPRLPSAQPPAYKQKLPTGKPIGS